MTVSLPAYKTDDSNQLAEFRNQPSPITPLITVLSQNPSILLNQSIREPPVRSFWIRTLLESKGKYNASGGERCTSRNPNSIHRY